MKNRKPLFMAIGLAAVLASGAGHASITFKAGWDSPENSNVRAYTKSGATDYLSDYSDELKIMIDKGACKLTVTKGCHQPNDPHFTLNGIGSKDSCKSTYAGSRSIHIPCSAR